jgi:DHA1 family tetracycline resistance protein-like MFS transporter
VGVYALLQFVGSPILGALSDQFGRRRVILIATAGAAIDYVIMACAPNLGWLFVGRVISGFTAGVLATANAYVADVTPPEKRAHGFGLLGAAFGLGLVLGPMLGGFLGGIDLRLPFWFAAACAAANCLYGFFVLPESLPAEHRRPFAWSRANPLGALRGLSRFPAVRRLADAYFILMLATMMLYSVWVLYMGYRFHWTPNQVGLSLGLTGVMSAVVQAVLVRRIVAALGDARTALLGFGISACAYAAYGLAPAGWVIYAIIPFGAFGGLAGPALQSFLTKHIPANEQGGVQGIFGGLSSLAGIPGPLIGTWSFGWAVAAHPRWSGLPFFEGTLLIVLAAALSLRSFRMPANAAAPGERVAA